MPEYTAKIIQETGRIDKVAADLFTDVSRSQVQTAIKNQQLQVNGQLVKAKYQVQPADEIKLILPEPEPIDAQPEPMALDIIYEDDQVIVINKPQGMVVHPAPGHLHGTLVNGLLAHGQLSSINGKIRPGIVHRIDRDTSGLLMVAKTDIAHKSLTEQLKNKTNLREYVALVHGVIGEESGTINAPLARDPKHRKRQAVVAGGRHAVTHFKVIERLSDYTLIRCRLETGRTHQIRVHLQYIKHPVAGDPLYGPKKTLSGNGQFLHAAKLGFTHPTTGEWLEFQAPLPPIFTETLAKLRAGETIKLVNNSGY
ncbi:pseudouridine synthase [Lapidilactobacillus dextrinicus DSM 20335]|uniref:Pseudouridine synthase n=1 Tax=Lapidilactobacillus dextrinicus DSM 20335 TaxID=1423738 RepID=A0A0R2BJ43_9LACO|nr:RluA family pseudouridine synthase [Lapidilactobacillus dextrinicus]KRM79242.1 pseudouridine synthase [Lapidilactobacillus dextrinicus DSM 20335]QFG46916.1 RluA family pseudouridine synthase [Lapidilactobacillus dextrinicus]